MTDTIVKEKKAWQEIQEEFQKVRQAHQREKLILQYQRWATGEKTLRDRVMEALSRVKVYLVTSWRRLVKRSGDSIAALLILIFFSPIMLLVAIGIKLTSRGPVLLKQVRVGCKGRYFTMYKFRSMYQDAEKMTGPIWASKNDPRVTPFGRFLRKTHLDELPQIFNVIRGEMSLVGPRPERPYFVDRFRKLIPHYDRRHFVKPGITGLAQIKRGYDQKLSDVKKKVRFDVLYIEKMCPLLDLKVLFMTVRTVVFKTGQ